MVGLLEVVLTKTKPCVSGQLAPVRAPVQPRHLVRLRECLQVLFELDSVRILVLCFHIGLVQINVVLHEGFLVQRLVVLHLSPDCTSLDDDEMAS